MSATATTTTVMSIKTDKKIKEKAQKLAKKMGFPLGTLINGFLRQFVREQAVHFSIAPQAPYKMSKKLEEELAGVEEDIKHGRNISPAFDNAEDLINYLHNAKSE